MAKARAYGIGFSDGERDGAIYTLHKVLSTLLKLLAPITPYITGSTNNIDIDQTNSTGSVSDVVVITANTSNGTIDIDQCTSGC